MSWEENKNGGCPVANHQMPGTEKMHDKYLLEERMTVGKSQARERVLA